MGAIRGGVVGLALACAAVAAPALPARAAPVPGRVVINEIHYHPVGDDEEFLELHNPGDEAIDLAGACFTAGIGGCFPSGTVLEAGGFAVAAQSLAAYGAAYPGAPAPALQYTGSLSNGGETVTVTSGEPAVLDTVTYTDRAPWPMTPDGDGPSLELADPLGPNDAADAWRAADPAPTPGSVNSQHGMGPGPAVASAEAGAVAAGQPIPFTVVADHATSVELEVTVGFDAPTTVALADDGVHGDGGAGDGVFGGVVPGVPAGTLVRYRAVAASASGTAMLPAAGSTRPRFGLVVDRPPVAAAIPVVDWYVDVADHARLLAAPRENTYVPAVVAVGGEVWDGAEVRISGHGRNPLKYSYKIKMPKGSPLIADFLAHPVDEFVLDGDLGDPTGVLNPLAASVYADTNPLIAQTAKVHVEQNGAAFGLFTFTEEYDALWRQRSGLDGAGDEQFEPEDFVGVFADGGSAAAVAARYEKEAPDDADFTHVYELIRAIDSAPTPERMARLRDLFDVPALIEALAVGAVLDNWDVTVHNYVLVREGSTGRWQIVPRDYDAVLKGIEGLFPFGPDNLVSALRSDPELEAMYLRRVRSLADRYLGRGELAQRLAALAPTVTSELTKDLARWPRALPTQAQGLADRRAVIRARTTELLTTRRTTDDVPAAASGAEPITIASARYVGEGGPARDAVRLRNPSGTEAVDLSGWRLQGAGTATLPPGSVIPARGEIVIPADEAVSAVDRLPGTLVAGALDGGLDDAGGLLEVVDATGAIRGSAILGDLGPTAPPAPTGLAVEASADQVETIAAGGAGVRLTVAVTNRGPGPARAVTLAGPGTTCGRTLGTVPAGASVVVRCSTSAGPHLDRTYRFRATTGPTTAASNRVEVRTLRHQTNYWSTSLPGAPRVGTVSLGDGNTIHGPVTLAPPTASAGPDTPPVRWLVATALEPGRAVPTQGAVVPPGAVATIAFAEGVPVRLAFAARNGAGTGARSPLTPFLTPRPTTSWPHASAAEQVAGIFQVVDGRDPTPEELASGVARLQAGESAADLIEERLGRGRWPTQVEPLIRLYAAYFDRPPDAAGLRYWLARRADGRTLDRISSTFAASAEFTRSTGSLDDAAFVRFVYSEVLGRSPDASGLAYWVGRLRAGWSRGRIMTAFSESGEGQAKLAPQVGPVLVATALLGRPPSASEAQPGTDWLRAGGSLDTVIDGVRSSDAFADRVG